MIIMGSQMIGVWTLRGLDLAGEVGHAHLQAIDIIRWHDTRSVCSPAAFRIFSFCLIFF